MSSALDLFAGAGGWSVAADRLGIDETGVEIMAQAVETRSAAGFKTHEIGDVWDFPFAEHRGRYDGLIASPPCQTFSSAGKGSGRKALDDVLNLIDAKAYRSIDVLRESADALGDERTALVLSPLHAAWEMRPEWIAWEQVPTVLPVWQACAEELRSWGYSVWTGNLQAEMYGVPQTRKRAFLIAHREREVTPPAPTHSRYYSRNPSKLDEGVQKWVSMAEALGWGLPARPSPTVTGGGTETGGAEPIAKLARYTEREDWVYRANKMANGAVRALEEPAPTVAFGHDAASVRWMLRNNSSANAAERELDKPAPTLYFGQRSNYVAWEPTGQRRNSSPGAERDPRSVGEPSYTIRAAGSGSHPSGVEWVADGTAWPYRRPSTTIVGTFKPEIVAAPGYRTTVSRQNAPDSVRVTVQEAGILQSFPADFPWQGAKGKQYLQCGNAVPPVLAEAVLSVLV